MNLIEAYNRLVKPPGPGGFPHINWQPNKRYVAILFKGIGKAIYCWGHMESHSYTRRSHHVSDYESRQTIDVPKRGVHTVTMCLQFEYYEDLHGYFTDITSQLYYNIDLGEVEYLTCTTDYMEDRSEPHQDLYYARLQFQCAEIRRKTY